MQRGKLPVQEALLVLMATILPGLSRQPRLNTTPVGRPIKRKPARPKRKERAQPPESGFIKSRTDVFNSERKAKRKRDNNDLINLLLSY